MKHSIKRAGVAILSAFMLLPSTLSAQTQTTSPAPDLRIVNATIGKSVVVADGQDRQSVTFIVNTPNVSDIKQVDLFVNNPPGTQCPSNARGHFMWNATQGWYSNRATWWCPPGEDYFGANHVNLLSGTAEPDGNGNTIFTITWTVNASSGAVSVDDMRLIVTDSTNHTLALTEGNYGQIGRFDIVVAPKPVGTIDITATNDVPAGNIPANAKNIPLASFNVHVTGEPIDIRTITFRAETNGVLPSAIDSLVLYDKQGKALTSAIDIATKTAVSTDTFTLQPGDNVLTLKGTIDATAKNGDQITMSLDMGANDFDAKGTKSGLDIVPASAVSVRGPLQTVQSAPPSVPTLSSINVSNQKIWANGEHRQILFAEFDVQDPESIDDVRFIINYPNAYPNDARGYFVWTKAEGFRSVGGAFHGEQHVNDLSGATQVTQYDNEHKIFRIWLSWAVNPSAGVLADNRISYYIADMANHYASGWHDSGVSYETTDQFIAPTVPFGPFTWPQVTYADGKTVQTATITINAASATSLDEISLAVNEPSSSSNNPPRGQFRWTAANGFETVGGDAFGNNYVRLIPENPNDPWNGSFRQVYTWPGTIYVTFRWTYMPGTPPTTGNKISYSIADTAHHFATGWKTPTASNYWENSFDDSFDIVAPAPQLRVTTLPMPQETTYAPGTQNIPLAQILLDATGSDEDIVVSQLTFKDSLWENAKGMDMQNVALFVDPDGDSFDGIGSPAQITNTQSGISATPNNADLFTYNLSGADKILIKAGKKVVLTAKGKLSPTAVPGSKHSFWIYSYQPIQAYGNTTANQAVVTMDKANAAPVIVVGQPGGTVQVSLDASTPSSRLYAAGTQGVTLGVFNFLATTTEDVEIMRLKFTALDANQSPSSYLNYTRLFLVDENGQTVGSVIPTNNEPRFNLNPGAVIVRTNDTDGVRLTLKADVAQIGPVQAITSGGRQLGFKIADPIFVGAKGSASNELSRVYFSASQPPIGNAYYLYRGVPSVTILPINQRLTNGQNDLFKVQISANESDIDVNKLSFLNEWTSADLHDLQLSVITDSGNETVLRSVSGLEVYNMNRFVRTYLSFDTPPVTIARGQSRTFVLRGILSGVASGSFMSTKLLGEDLIPDTLAYGSPASENDVEHTSAKFIWSDRSSGGHSLLTPDWTNGYLVSGMPRIASTPTIISF